MLTLELKGIGKQHRYNVLQLFDKTLRSEKTNADRFNIPSKLPMICKPMSYTRIRLGGYLLNDVNYSEDLIIKKYNIKNKSLISAENIIYNMINNISSTPYKINTELFDYILMNKHNLLINPDESSKYENIKKKSKYQQSKYNSHISKLNLQELYYPSD
jgi:DNA-directed RNA polymerase